ncbi:MAG: O-antigen ligase family protein [Sphingobacteriales bacterium JAD_PAG50586_3]|nr:MAG: O-antigen ligase family protein [Sphingobacteriales bacterium JAD_PAG50586_3]
MLVGLAYTTNFDYGLKDIRVKLPLFLLPFVIVGLGSLKEKEYRGLLLFFVLMVVSSTIAGYATAISNYGTTYEARQLSPYISNIRLSLLIIMAIFIAGWLAIKLRNLWFSIAAALTVIWLLFFLYKLESLTALGTIFIVWLALIIFNLKDIKPKALRIALPLLLAAFAGWFCYYTNTTYTEYFTPKVEVNPSEVTKYGNTYDVVDMPYMIENGNPIWAHVSGAELREEWPKRSSIHIDSTDAKKQPLYYTLIRYMASKGLKKDREGIAELTNTDITNIENGIANANYTEQRGLKARLHKIFGSTKVYKAYHNPSGHSVFMRLEFWRNSWGIIKDNPVVGVGTGDVIDAVAMQYNKCNSQLDAKWRLRSHNQFLAIGIALGIIGMLIFPFSMFYPFISAKGYKSIMFTAFFVTAFLSMLTEDTLESQAGVSFYVFFFCVFLFLKPGALTTPQIGWGWWDKPRLEN